MEWKAHDGLKLWTNGPCDLTWCNCEPWNCVEETVCMELVQASMPTRHIPGCWTEWTADEPCQEEGRNRGSEWMCDAMRFDQKPYCQFPKQSVVTLVIGVPWMHKFAIMACVLVFAVAFPVFSSHNMAMNFKFYKASLKDKLYHYTKNFEKESKTEKLEKQENQSCIEKCFKRQWCPVQKIQNIKCLCHIFSCHFNKMNGAKICNWAAAKPNCKFTLSSAVAKAAPFQKSIEVPCQSAWKQLSLYRMLIC